MSDAIYMHDFCITYVCKKGAVRKFYVSARSESDALNNFKADAKEVLSVLLNLTGR
jgi:hypothetical protein